MDTSTTPFPCALEQAPADIRDRLLSYRPTSVPPALFQTWAPHLVALAAAYGPASPVEAKVTLTALCQLLGLVGPQLAHPSLTDLLTENHIGLLRARLIEARTNEGTINNRIGRLNQLMAVTRGLARTHIRTPVATPSDEPGQTTAYSIEEMAVLRELGDQDPMVAHIISAGLDAGLTVKHHLLTTVWRGRGVTETDWVHARDYAARAGVALVATRLRATWRQRLVDQPVPFTRLVTAHGLTSTDLSHVRPADTGTVLAHTDALR